MRTVIAVVLAPGLWAVAAGPAAAQDSPKLPMLDVVIGNNFGHLPMFVGVDKGLRYDPRISRNAVRAFEEAQEDILRLTLTGAPARLPIPEQFTPSFMAEVERAYPQYFSDLAPLPADAR
jgi:hypothetical protein